MKLFMMPQTVPNRPTNGAVAPMLASSAHAAARCAGRPTPRRAPSARPPAPSARTDRDCAESRTSCCAVRTSIASGSRARPSPAAASASVRASASTRRWRRARRLAAASSEALGEPDGPGHERREHQADHHDLHHEIRTHEHAPGRQVARQRRAGDHWRARRCSVRRCNPGGAVDCACSGAGADMAGCAPAGGAAAGDCAKAAAPIAATIRIASATAARRGRHNDLIFPENSCISAIPPPAAAPAGVSVIMLHCSGQRPVFFIRPGSVALLNRSMLGRRRTRPGPSIGPAGRPYGPRTGRSRRPPAGTRLRPRVPTSGRCDRRR